MKKNHIFFNLILILCVSSAIKSMDELQRAIEASKESFRQEQAARQIQQAQVPTDVDEDLMFALALSLSEAQKRQEDIAPSVMPQPQRIEASMAGVPKDISAYIALLAFARADDFNQALRTLAHWVKVNKASRDLLQDPNFLEQLRAIIKTKGWEDKLAFRIASFDAVQQKRGQIYSVDPRGLLLNLLPISIATPLLEWEHAHRLAQRINPMEAAAWTSNKAAVAAQKAKALKAFEQAANFRQGLFNMLRTLKDSKLSVLALYDSEFIDKLRQTIDTKKWNTQLGNFLGNYKDFGITDQTTLGVDFWQHPGTDLGFGFLLHLINPKYKNIVQGILKQSGDARDIKILALIQNSNDIELISLLISLSNNKGDIFDRMFDSQSGDLTPLFNSLFDKGLSIDITDSNGTTPLMYVSVDFNSPAMTAAIMAKGPNVNAQDIQGNTALMYTIRNPHKVAGNTGITQGKMNLALKLLDAGADKNIKNMYGLTAYDMSLRGEPSGRNRALLIEPYTKYLARLKPDRNN